jgi:hypothetical protein
MALQENSTAPMTFAEQRRHTEAMWRDVIDAFYPGGQMVNISPSHRVIRHGGKAIKIQYSGDAVAIEPSQSVEAEYGLLKALDGAAGPLEPTLRSLRPGWQALELAWVDGHLLADVLVDPAAPVPSLRALATTTFAVARRGIIYSQFRGRHIIVGDDGRMTFIDFGGSRKSSAMRALLHTFTPVARGGGGWKAAPFWYLAKKIVDRRRRPPDVDATVVKRMAHWSFAEQAAEVGFDLACAAGRHLSAAEEAIKRAEKEDRDIVWDIPTVFIGPFYIRGSEHWELLWHDITRATAPRNRRVTVLNAGLGLAAIFAADDGAAEVRAYEPNKHLSEAAGHLKAAFGGETSTIQTLPDPGIPADLDMVIQISHRVPRDEQAETLRAVSAARDIVFRTNLTDRELDDAVGTGRPRSVLRTADGWRLVHFGPPEAAPHPDRPA